MEFRDQKGAGCAPGGNSAPSSSPAELEHHERQSWAGTASSVLASGALAITDAGRKHHWGLLIQGKISGPCSVPFAASTLLI